MPWEGLDDIRSWLAGIRETLENPAALLRETVAPLLRDTIAENLAAGGRPPFPPLEETTLAARAMDDRRPQLPGARPLVGGTLEESYQSGPHHIEEVERNTLTLGSDIGAIHEFGGSHAYPIRPRSARALRYVGRTARGIGWRNDLEVQHPPLPARPVLTLPAEAEQRLIEALEEAIPL